MRFADSLKKNKPVEAKAESPRYQINSLEDFNQQFTKKLTN